MGGGGVDAPDFPTDFQKGVGLSVWQNSSDTTSNWSHFAKKKNYFGQKGLKEAWLKSNDFWNLYEADIGLARQQIGATSFRFSFEWSRLQPHGPGEFDPEAVEKFHSILYSIASNGMEPMVTWHHFTHPQWFEEKGGFANEDNIPYFVEYCKKVFALYGSRIKLWATFNEPTCFSFVGYIIGLWCPGKLMKFTLAGEVLLCLLKSHVAVYDAIKAMPGGSRACVGLVHQHVQFVPRTKLFHVNKMCHWMTYFFASETMLEFFKTGEFKWKIPISGTVIRYSDPTAPSKLDWWGINYYSRPCVDWKFGMGPSHDNEPVSDTHFRLYPQGLYDSIAEASILGKPIFITETGLADKADKHRRWFIQTHFCMIMKAISDGYDVRGVYFWTLMDNIEWHEGFHIKFGLFEWNPDPTVNCMGMRLREGSKGLVEMYASWPNSLVDIHHHAAANKNPVMRRVLVDSDSHNSIIIQRAGSGMGGQIYGSHSSSRCHPGGSMVVQPSSEVFMWGPGSVVPAVDMGPGLWAEKRPTGQSIGEGAEAAAGEHLVAEQRLLITFHRDLIREQRQEHADVVKQYRDLLRRSNFNAPEGSLSESISVQRKGSVLSSPSSPSGMAALFNPLFGNKAPASSDVMDQYESL